MRKGETTEGEPSYIDKGEGIQLQGESEMRDFGWPSYTALRDLC